MNIFRTLLAGPVSALAPSVTILSTVLAFVAFVGSAAPPLLSTAHANGASTIIMDRIQGPYRVVVGIIPARPVIPQTHLAIQVFDSANEMLLRDTDVDLRVAASGPAGSSDFGPELVFNEQTLRYFEVDVPFNAIGPWDVSMRVSSHLGDEEFNLNLDVQEPRAQIQWIWITAVLVAIFAVGAWTWLTLQRRRNVT